MDKNIMKITAYRKDGEIIKKRETLINDLEHIQKILNNSFSHYYELKIIYLDIEENEMKLCFNKQVDEVICQNEDEDYYIIKAPVNILNEIKKILHR